MRHKELRLGLVCYGGISLAVYMHGVTKEVWKLARASRAFHAGDVEPLAGSERVYLALLRRFARDYAVNLRVLCDIIAGASAGGINGVFLAQAVHSGQSLDPLTDLWLERADVEVLLDPEAHSWTRPAKVWLVPLLRMLLTQPGNVVSTSVAPETRTEVRAKLARLIGARWFAPPFGGIGFSRLLAEALDAMAQTRGAPLLPPGHPLDLFVTATDFAGRPERLVLHSPPQAEESEHRLSIGFARRTPHQGGGALAALPELVFAARATASFPGAFPPLRLAEIDALLAEREQQWPGREAFVARVLPGQLARGEAENVSLIDGSVLVNAPFAAAMAVLSARPAQREVDRRLVYIDPRPKDGVAARNDPRLPGFFTVIFGSLSAIPREQPIRDNLETLDRRSRERARIEGIVRALRPEVDAAVERVFRRTLFFNSPSAGRLSRWRARAMQVAASEAGFAYEGYAQLKFAGVVDSLARLIAGAAPTLGAAAGDTVYRQLCDWLAARDMTAASAPAAGTMGEFFRSHDLAFRIRRLRLLLRRLADEETRSEAATPGDFEAARSAIYAALSHYFTSGDPSRIGDFAEIAAHVGSRPQEVLAAIGNARDLIAIDRRADALLARALMAMPEALRRRMLLTYLGFPFYDIVTLPLLRGEDLSEYDPVKVDRISPDDAGSIRAGGAAACLRGVEFYNFGAFFSRAYRENDYLWGRLHGAERMIDLLVSALPEGAHFAEREIRRAKREIFLAILEEEDARLVADRGLIAGIRREVIERLDLPG
ncbi:MAG: patatin-like protein [Sphingomonadales bacterium]|nr:patatin-like protein [Sphingomonadales bacterium]